MNRENVIKWVKGLRSGRYTQTTGRLADDKGFCCLGVAPEEAIADGVYIERKTITDEINSSVFQYTYESGVSADGFKYMESATLPASAMEWLGVTDTNPPIIPTPRDSRDMMFNFRAAHPNEDIYIRDLTLANLNDAGFTLDQIADVIVYFWLGGSMEGE